MLRRIIDRIRFGLVWRKARRASRGLREQERQRSAWHRAICAHAGVEGWMFEAKTASIEVKRLQNLFRYEREGRLPDTYRQCSRSAPEPVHDNHLTCCLGVVCRECPHLLALDAEEEIGETIDLAKAWTCVAHILSEGGDRAGEGYVLTTDDRMFWDRTYANLRRGDELGEQLNDQEGDDDA